MGQEQTSARTRASEPSYVRSLWQRRIVWGLWLGLVLAGTALLLPAEYVSDTDFSWTFSHLWNPVYRGGLLGVASVLAVWCVLAPAAWWQRALGTLGLAALWLLAFCGALCYLHYYGVLLEIRPIALVLVLEIGLFGLARGLLSWRLGWAEVAGDRSAPARWQFTMRQLFLAMTATAVFLALGRTLQLNWDKLDYDQHVLIREVVLWLVVAVPTAVLALRWLLGQTWRWPFALVTLLFVAAVAMVLGPPGRWWFDCETTRRLRTFLPYGWANDLHWFLFQGGFTVVLLGTLQGARLCGYRLGGRPAADRSSGADGHEVTRPRTLWQAPLRWLILELALFGVGIGLVASWLAIPRRAAHAAFRMAHADTAWLEKATFPADDLVWIEFPRGKPVPEEDLRMLGELESFYGWLEENSSDWVIPDDLYDPPEGWPALRFSDTLLKDAQMGHLRAVPHLRTLFLANTPITDAGLDVLEGSPHIESLDLSGTAITDAGLKRLQGLTKLKELDLSGTAITDAGLAWLQGLERLETLRLSKTAITGIGLAHLRCISTLQELTLDATQLTDDGMRPLRDFSNLRRLNLNRTAITGAGLAYLQDIPNLWQLHLAESSIHEDELVHLSGRVKSLSLDLSGTQVTDAGLSYLVNLKDCTSVVLSRTRVTDAGLGHLAKIKTLRYLGLAGTAITDAGLPQLTTLEDLHALDLSATRVTDAGLADLKSLPHLGGLYLRQTAISEAGLRQLSALGNLHTLDLVASGVTDAIVPVLESCNSLSELRLSGPTVTAQAAQRLQEQDRRRTVKYFETPEAAEATP